MRSDGKDLFAFPLAIIEVFKKVGHQVIHLQQQQQEQQQDKKRQPASMVIKKDVYSTKKTSSVSESVNETVNESAQQQIPPLGEMQAQHRVKLGDASLVASFTSTRPTISAVLDLLK